MTEVEVITLAVLVFLFLVLAMLALGARAFNELTRMILDAILQIHTRLALNAEKLTTIERKLTGEGPTTERIAEPGEPAHQTEVLDDGAV